VPSRGTFRRSPTGYFWPSYMLPAQEHEELAGSSRTPASGCEGRDSQTACLMPGTRELWLLAQGLRTPQLQGKTLLAQPTGKAVPGPCISRAVGDSRERRLCGQLRLFSHSHVHCDSTAGVPLADTSAPASKLYSMVGFSRFSVTVVLNSDRRTQFTSSLWSEPASFWAFLIFGPLLLISSPMSSSSASTGGLKGLSSEI
jgi:hypothetical protein